MVKKAKNVSEGTVNFKDGNEWKTLNPKEEVIVSDKFRYWGADIQVFEEAEKKKHKPKKRQLFDLDGDGDVDRDDIKLAAKTLGSKLFKKKSKGKK